jgi:hypothetical protein
MQRITTGFLVSPLHFPKLLIIKTIKTSYIKGYVDDLIFMRMIWYGFSIVEKKDEIPAKKVTSKT